MYTDHGERLQTATIKEPLLPKRHKSLVQIIRFVSTQGLFGPCSLNDSWLLWSLIGIHNDVLHPPFWAAPSVLGCTLSSGLHHPFCAAPCVLCCTLRSVLHLAFSAAPPVLC